MEANADKCYLITSKSENIAVNEENNPIKNSRQEKLLVVKIDYELTFNFHFTKICKETGQKMNTLSRIVPYINIEIRRTLLKILLASQFGYSNLIWICCSRASNNKTHRLHESCLRVICNDKISFIKQLMERRVLPLFLQELFILLLQKFLQL